jgi:hypothetical protein
MPTAAEPALPSSVHDASLNYRLALFECLEDWHCFVTNRGYIGVGPGAMHEGDEIVILDGSAVPSLLRLVEAKDGARRYKLVGECYVHGLMQGEGKRLMNVWKGWLGLC